MTMNLSAPNVDLMKLMGSKKAKEKTYPRLPEGILEVDYLGIEQESTETGRPYLVALLRYQGTVYKNARWFVTNTDGTPNSEVMQIMLDQMYHLATQLSLPNDSTVSTIAKARGKIRVSVKHVGEKFANVYFNVATAETADSLSTVDITDEEF